MGAAAAQGTSLAAGMGVPIEQLIRLKDHGVNAAFIQKMKERGYSDLTLDEYVRLRDRGTRE